MAPTDTEIPCPPLPAGIELAVDARIRSHRLELPLLPESASRVLELTLREDCDARELTALIHRDQGLAGNVLRLANSALYAPRVPIVSLDQAVTRLGFRRIREISLAVACEGAVFKVAPWEPLMKQEFRHALAAALFTQEIARHRRSNVEEAFLAGLMHDAGRPVILGTVASLAGPLTASIALTSLAPLLDRAHAAAGQALAAAWRFPASVVEAIRWHHEPSAAPGAKGLAAETSLGEILAHQLLDPEGAPPREITAQAAELNLYPDDLDTLRARGADIRTSVESLG